MAIRVTKLAKQLKRTPVEVLGLLHAVGYDRYKSSQDMLPDNVVERLRVAIREGVRPVQLEVARKAGPATRSRSGDPGKPGLMAALVPGVVPMDREAPAPAPVEQVRAPVPVPEPEPEPEPEPVLAAPVAPVAPVAPSAEVEAELDALHARVASLQAEVDTLHQRLAEVHQPPTLREVLEARGLRGRDEMERALVGLAERRVLVDALAGAHVTDGGALSELLIRRLVLVAGEPPAGLPESFVAVAVAPDRGELPSQSAIRQLASRLGEQLMLHGRTTLAVVAGDPLQLHLLAGALDPRIQLARGHLGDCDPECTVVVGWGAPVPDALRARGEAGAIVVEAPQGLAELVQAVEGGLASA